MSTTKNIQYVSIDEGMLEAFCDFRIKTELGKIQDIYRRLGNKVNSIGDGWIKVDKENFFIFINGSVRVLIPDTRKMKPTYWQYGKGRSVQSVLDEMKTVPQDLRDKWEKAARSQNAVGLKEFADKLLGLPARGISRHTARLIFQKADSPLTDKYRRMILEGYATTAYIITRDNDYGAYNIYDDNAFAGDFFLGVQLSVHEFETFETLFDMAEKYGIIPESLSDEEKTALKEISLLYKDGVRVGDVNSLKSYLRNSNRRELLGYSFDYDKIKEEVLSKEIDISGSSSISSHFRQYLDEYDFHRARIQKYNSRWYLSDEGKGHWDLWYMGAEQNAEETDSGDGDSASKRYVLHMKDGVIARNPLSDIKYDAVVGIDFGTKSTIVAVLDDNDHIIPLRVGLADYLEEPKREHYENPTVMQFIDLDAFCQAYHSRSGRPYTSWDDVKISHEAFENMINAKQSREYASFMSELKQWAGGRYGKNDRGRLLIRDHKGTRYPINDYESLTDEDIDPIELYAYYLGIFINNMHTGIYLDYLLSFPETFSLEVKERLLSSFRKGIKRSLPESIFDDDEAKAAFRVRQGPGEPAAYAACALEQYGIVPDDEGVFYGIFDFGGGTTDFDFGIWKNGPEDEDTYDYVLKHFCSGGDKSLGGENLLELLAYYVFCDNETASAKDGVTNFQRMRERKLVFSRPPEGKVFPGTEAMINSEESAVLNTKRLMEVLRPLWEEDEMFQLAKKKICSSSEVTEERDSSKKETESISSDFSFFKNFMCALEEEEGKISQSEKRSSGETMVIECGNNGQLSLHPDGHVTACVNLFDEGGNDKATVELQIDEELADQVLNGRIEQGVRNFFDALEIAYTENDIHIQKPIHIFLAGNSSRSRRVAELFEQYIEDYEQVMFDMQAGEESPHFVLFPPLGSPEALALQEEKGIHPEENEFMAPTGKTGVAFGMLMCRENSGIKVESEQKKTEQIRLGYYIGISSKKRFKLIFDRKTEYNKWHMFRKVSDEMETFEFYYTELPEAVSGELEIRNNPSVRRKKCLVDKTKEGAYIFFRFTAPASLEYVVAEKEAVEEGNYISSIYKVNL